MSFDILSFARCQRRMNQLYKRYYRLIEDDEMRFVATNTLLTTSSVAQRLLTDYSLLPLASHGRRPFHSIAFDPYSHLPHDPSHSELAGLSAKALELTMEMLSKEGIELLYDYGLDSSKVVWLIFDTLISQSFGVAFNIPFHITDRIPSPALTSLNYLIARLCKNGNSGAFCLTTCIWRYEKWKSFEVQHCIETFTVCWICLQTTSSFMDLCRSRQLFTLPGLYQNTRRPLCSFVLY